MPHARMISFRASTLLTCAFGLIANAALLDVRKKQAGITPEEIRKAQESEAADEEEVKRTRIMEMTRQTQTLLEETSTPEENEDKDPYNRKDDGDEESDEVSATSHRNSIA